MSDLREQIHAAPIFAAADLGKNALMGDRLRLLDAVMAVVQPELDAKDREIKSAWQNAEDWHESETLTRQRAETAEATIARVRQMADAWEQRLPEMILTATAVEALRSATERYALAQPAAQKDGDGS